MNLLDIKKLDTRIATIKRMRFRLIDELNKLDKLPSSEGRSIKEVEKEYNILSGKYYILEELRHQLDKP